MSTLDSRNGHLAALGAFFIWGIFPLYWKLLISVPALEIMLHRMLWCFVMVALVLILREGWRWWQPLRGRPRVFLALAASGLLISTNWFIYIWAVNRGHVVETSFGYYIIPLVNVALGTLLLKERLAPAQRLAVALAALGVLYLTLMQGRLPWIALVLAGSFSLYGLIRKQTDVGSVAGLALEGAIVMPFALSALAVLHLGDHAQFLSGSPRIDLLLFLGGAVTALPLILFAYGARRIPYSSLGMLQYLAPTLQLMIGVWIFHEPFNRDLLIGFILIWLALAIFTTDGIRRMARSSARR